MGNCLAPKEQFLTDVTTGAVTELVADGEPTRGSLLQTISTSENFELSLTLEVLGKREGWANILQFSEGESNEKEGDRIPGLWLVPKTTKLHVRMSREGEKNDGADPPQDLPIGEKTRITVRLAGNCLRVLFGEQEVAKNESYCARHPARDNVKVFFSCPWCEAADVIASNIRYVKLPRPGPEVLLAEQTKPTWGQLLQTVSTFENFELSLDVHPVGKRQGWASIIHFTEGENLSKEGDRIPGLWFRPKTTKLHVRMSRQGQLNDGVDSPKDLPIGQTTHVTVRLEGSCFRVLLGGQEVAKSEAYSARHPARPGVKIFLSDPWHEAANAWVANIRYSKLASPPPPSQPGPEAPRPGPEAPIVLLAERTQPTKGKLLQTVSTFENFELSFDVQPLGKRNGWGSIIHFTEGENCSREGDRIPGLWFFPKTTKLHVRMSRQGNHNDGVDPPKELPIGQTAHVVVRLEGSCLRVLLGGQEVGKSESFSARHPARPNVKVFISDPWHEAANAWVSNVRYSKLASPPPPQPPKPLPAPPANTPNPTWDEVSAAAADSLVKAMDIVPPGGLSSREISECAQILASRTQCRYAVCTPKEGWVCRYRHGNEDVLFDAAKGAPLTRPYSYGVAGSAPIVSPHLPWWLLGDAFERLGPEAFQLSCARHAAAMEHFKTREGARMVADGLPDPDELQSFALNRVQEIWGDVVHRESCQEYLDRSGEKVMSKVTGSDYSAPSRRPVKAWDGPQGTVNISRIIKIGLRNPNVDFEKPRDTAWHGCQARNLQDWKPAKPNTPPCFRAEKSIHKAHGGGVYVTPAFEHAVGYAFRKWDRSPRFAVHRTASGDRWNYLTIMQVAIYDRGKPGAVKVCRKTWGGLPGDGWDNEQLEWIVEDVSKGQIYGILFCFFPDDPPQGG